MTIRRRRDINVLVIDIGGSHAKFRVWGKRQKRKFATGTRTTPAQLAARVVAMTKDWKYDAVSIGYPGFVVHGKIARDPKNLGRGWVGFHFERYFHKPVKIINDAAMQALGSYRGGRMLFLGLGTNLGSSLILDDVVIPLDLGQLGYSEQETLGDVLSKESLVRYGWNAWQQAVHKTTERLALAFRADYVVIGGGNVRLLKRLPGRSRRGSNNYSFTGGARLWGLAGLEATPRKHTWVIT
jgi:predicted NBD/HSP70 family sugar kinase